MSDNKENKTPAWKRDFPLRREEATHVSRREFAKFLGLFSGGLALASTAIVIKSLAFPHKELEGEHFVCRIDQLPETGMFQFEIEGSKTVPYILLHLPGNQYRAYEQKCTHLACAVRYLPEKNIIECPCHKGHFDPDTGRVLQGPPPRPLPKLEVIRKNDGLYVRAFKNV
ncbi:ubiquinol-cytochrome c reductase iron-sulfur subunit [Geofilum rubicundum]|uniref:Ubiquinol-cytochrome C reductase iron-sulfur subunit n=1 Tax=Geofilum rubicundum JCM 15548 TaxID=1236989 RepID=A0A0E9LYP3_9BACT|nr:Rieske (2Fe-2S) protein [Geofilum rubicundum]GAO30707.1 ubiquinol-cytochrome C reductase iron-sulfur subunit [Geofilum rubicundum JCM 15548]